MRPSVISKKRPESSDAGDGRVQSVPLERLPEGFELPAGLAGKMWFDCGGKVLAYRGFMSKATFDRLELLSDYAGYQRALEDLFRASVYEEPKRPREYSLKSRRIN
jgi:hypothetical protein